MFDLSPLKDAEILCKAVLLGRSFYPHFLMNSKRNRKSLDDALAQQFIYGEEQQETPKEPVSEPQPEEPTLNSPESLAALLNVGGIKQKQQNKLYAITKFQAPPKEPTIRFTVDLSQSMHQRLSLLAATTGMKKADIVRLLLNDALEDAGF